jgi:glycosyltransferase involved in cell wall biosynthesis
VKNILVVAFHYPPYELGSGVHRTLKLSRYLPNYGWQPIVLTANPRAYAKVGKELMSEIPRDVAVKRAFALDAARHLSFRGRYMRVAALPDQWASWWLGAVCSGLRLIRKYRPEILWSTYPIATAHLIGLTLHRLSGLPWVADFRDSMTEENYPRDKWSWKIYRWIERLTVQYAARLVFTTPSTINMYLERYPQLTRERCLLIPNGYDEDDFIGVERSANVPSFNGRPIRLLHAGLLYTDERDPRAFFLALSRLKKESLLSRNDVRIDLRASGSEDYYKGLLKELAIDDLVHLLPAISHRQALQDCAAADALLLFQAASCNHQIPAKAYEYLRFGKPILALTPLEGDTAKLLVETDGATIVDLARDDEIYRMVPLFLKSLRDSTHRLPNPDQASRYSRKHQAYQISKCLSEVVTSE